MPWNDGKSDDSISREEFRWCQRSVSGGMELKGGANGVREKDDGKSDDSISREEFKWCQRSVSGGEVWQGGQI